MERSNQQVAGVLAFMGQLLEIKGENVFKIRAFYRASDIVERLARPVAGMDEHELDQIEGIGKNIAKKIIEIVTTGTCAELEELKSEIPTHLIELLKLEGIGPKTVAILWKKLGIQSIDDLEREAKGHRIRAIKGFGEKKEEIFLASIAHLRKEAGRMNRFEAEAVVEKVSPAMTPGTFEVAGSFRRGKSTVGDIDIISTERPSVLNPKIRQIAEAMIDEGDRKTSFRILSRRVDIRFSRPEQFGSMSLYLTGSKPFNIRLRELAITKGYKISEYGIEERDTGKLVEFSTEEDMFAFLGLPYIPPELREDWGEVERARANDLPKLVGQSDIRGDLHVHSDWSDGRTPIGKLAETGALMGYDYIVCTDHAPRTHIMHGLDPDKIKERAHEIEVANRSSRCRVLEGIEVDIMSDGSIGLSDAVLADLDFVIASIHAGFREERDVMTRRILGAMENENVDVIGHPTGRLIGQRTGYEVDLSRVIELAARTKTALELNASPYRLDLDDMYVKQAVDTGVKIAIGTDAHQSGELSEMRYGITTARRGWCRPSDVLNTMSAESLLEWAG
ncbi:MAG: DNA polymerase/3'-5' exonuclease PolX [Methanoregulaceae archaeon]|nr:DNA polymerase/3'-5' exonuclease PolX [Methanoregulaceae archaeon]